MNPSHENDPSEAITWTVFRQDDNGTRFVVATDLNREEAEQLVRLYESRGHKQVYWIDPVLPN